MKQVRQMEHTCQALAAAQKLEIRLSKNLGQIHKTKLKSIEIKY